MTKPSLAPRQARSRESETKLIKAAVDVLGRYGLEGATIPRVAEHAGLTPGAVYRRFPDKNALLERCILRILEDQLKHLERALTPEIASKSKLAPLVEEIVRAMLVSYQNNAKLLHALRQFSQASDHRAFKRKAVELEIRAVEHLLDVLMAHKKHIRHPDPRAALSMALVTLSATLAELFVVDDNLKRLQKLMPTDDESLVRELTRMFLSYIGAG
jgi:AcrR family transcriptional regulator